MMPTPFSSQYPKLWILHNLTSAQLLMLSLRVKKSSKSFETVKLKVESGGETLQFSSSGFMVCIFSAVSVLAWERTDNLLTQKSYRLDKEQLCKQSLQIRACKNDSHQPCALKFEKNHLNNVIIRDI